MSGKPAANRMTLQAFRAKEVGAKKGYKLLKQKRDALKTKFAAMLKEIVKTKLEVGTGLKDAAFSLAKAQWASAGVDITSMVLERVSAPSITCKLSSENVAGVKLPIFKMVHDSTKDANVQTIGVAHGGAVIQACRETYFKAVENLIKLASLQTAFVTLDEEIKMTARRVNALEYVIIPRIQDIIKYIDQELDEQSRDDLIRVKKVVQKKREKAEKQKKEDDKEAELLAAKGIKKKPTGGNPMDAESALDAGKDPDVIF